MRAEIVSIGSELLLGHTINSDAAFIARALAEMGIDLLNVQTVGDNTERLGEALALAASRSDIIITSGGLGPTDDDLTKTAIARFAGCELVRDEASWKRLKEYFGQREMSANQIRQAYLPTGSVVFANDLGTAPGCAIKTQAGKHILMLPGPPRELVHMLDNYARPYLLSLSHEVISSSQIMVFGMGEGAVAQKIEDLVNSVNPTVATYAKSGEMFVKITAKANSPDQARALCAPLIEEVKSRLGDVVYGVDVANLETVVVQGLINNNMTIATAESCTGGLVAKRITDIAGASNIFGLGLVTYANAAKEHLLQVPSKLIEEKGAVSEEVAAVMAKNVRSLAGADIGLGLTGIAGPGGGSSAKPVGLVYIAIAHKDGVFVRKMKPLGRYLGRDWVRERAASHALDMARRFLLGLPLDITWI